MYLNGIKHNVVTKLNPLTLNVGSDGQTDGQKVFTIAHPEHSSGELKMKGAYIICERNNKRQ